ncbi:TRAP transporter small permease subunit [Billgrantia azerbaijanica]|nr:TRAP transporter small permease subunit [Halomonas azerbaijanica]
MKASDQEPSDGLGRKTAEAERIAEEMLHHHTALPQTRLSKGLDSVLTAIGKAASWLWLVVVAVIIWAVVGRYAFGQGSVTLEEWQWHIAGAAWLLGLSYTLTTDDHVRVDVIHERLSLKAQGRIELLGILLLLLPFLAISLYELAPYAMSSYLQGETSQSPAGLSHRWILKAVVALSFALLILATVSRLLRVTALLFGFPKPIADDTTKGEAS